MRLGKLLSVGEVVAHEAAEDVAPAEVAAVEAVQSEVGEPAAAGR
jgi:hypothetical protein